MSGVVPDIGAASVYVGAARPKAAYAAASALRSSSRWVSRTGVTPAVRTGSVQENGSSSAALREEIDPFPQLREVDGLDRGHAGHDRNRP